MVAIETPRHLTTLMRERTTCPFCGRQAFVRVDLSITPEGLRVAAYCDLDDCQRRSGTVALQVAAG
ncbi:MAG TPA: hypothetical protein VEA41_03005 [Salinarimonas sp.]|nr:hypothetical protein [Salinarimonas sp.]